jgi:gluconolactonase
MLADMSAATTLLSGVRPLQAVLERPHGLLEAPRFGPGGEVVYSDVIAGGVWTCSPGGRVRELLGKRRGIGGIVPHADGGWVLSGRSVVHLSADGHQRELLSGEGVCGYNDLGSTPAGELLAGVLRYRPLAGEPERPGQLVKLDHAGEIEVLSEELTWPNGIGVSADARTVYVSDYSAGVVLSVAIEGGHAREFCRSPRGSADGLALDAEGALWVALGEGGAVARFHPDGTLDQIFPLPASFVSSLSFGGEDMRDVLITTADNVVRPELGGTLLIARSEVPGLAVAAVNV